MTSSMPHYNFIGFFFVFFTYVMTETLRQDLMFRPIYEQQRGKNVELA